jgi:hypothetical protein
MCDLKPFEIVECVDDTPVLKQSKTMPGAGRLYHVASVKRVGDGYSVRLLELAPDCYMGGSCICGNCGWDSGRFRRHHRPDDQLAIFQAMLENSGRTLSPASEPVA